MPNTKVSVLYFQSSFNIADYLHPPIGIEVSEDLAMSYHGNFWQFRHIERDQNGDVLGRLCKIRTLQHNKPTLGDVSTAVEQKPTKDVIDSAHFRFHQGNNTLICEKKSSVTSVPNGVFFRLLCHLHPDSLHRDDGIDMMFNEDVTAHLIRNRPLIAKSSLRLLPATAVNLFRGDETMLELGDTDFGQFSELKLELHFVRGNLKKSLLDRILRLIQSGKMSQESIFHIKGESSMPFSHYAKSTQLSFITGNNEDEHRNNIYDALRRAPV